MRGAVDSACATSDYTAAISLQNAQAENISSRAPTVTAADNGLTDDTELVYSENALAHRGADLWIGYNDTADLVKLWAQLDNYNFWVRKFTLAGGWELPRNVTKVEDKRINVREPRFFGTPNSSATAGPTENPADPSTTDPTLCQDANTVFLAWGTQENVSPCDPDGGDDLGIFITVSTDSGRRVCVRSADRCASGRQCLLRRLEPGRLDDRRFLSCDDPAVPTPSDIPPPKPPRGGSLLTESGLTRVVLPLCDRHFVVALAAAVPVWLAIGFGAAGPVYRPAGLLAWLAFVLWQPLLEELVFRGLLQGQLLRILRGRRVGPVSAANLLATVAFAAMHLFAQPPAWALAVAVPSLVFGHLRERYDSVWPAVAMHALYNAGFGVAAVSAVGGAG